MKNEKEHETLDSFRVITKKLSQRWEIKLKFLRMQEHDAYTNKKVIYNF